MLTPEQFLQKIHEIAASTPPEDFEHAVRQMCNELAREIALEEKIHDSDPEPDC